MEVFGKAGAAPSGSSFTTTAQSLGASGKVVGSWDYSGTATPTTYEALSPKLLSDGEIASSLTSSIPPTLFLGAVAAAALATAVALLLIKRFRGP